MKSFSSRKSKREVKAIHTNKKQLDSDFNETYKLYVESIYKFCLSKLSCNEEYAKDCTQDTFLIYYKRLKNGEAFNNPRAFLYKTANNFVKKKYDEIKKNLSNQTPLNESSIMLADNMTKVEINVDFNSFQKRLSELLSNEEKALYTKRFVELKSIDCIASELGINKKYCAVKISRLRQKIRTELGEYKL